VSRRNFEVVVISPHLDNDGGYRIRTPPGEQFTATNVTLKNLILEAIHIQDFQLILVWAGTEKFDIAAKVDAEGNSAKMLSPEELRPLLQDLPMTECRRRGGPPGQGGCYLGEPDSVEEICAEVRVHLVAKNIGAAGPAQIVRYAQAMVAS
jgi:hypothetical protein